MRVSEKIKYKRWEGHTDMSEDEDAPGTWGDKNGFGRPYIPFSCTGLLIPSVVGNTAARHWLGDRGFI